MAFKDMIEILDGERLSLTTKATIQNSGRLNFTPETTKLMGLSGESTILLFKAGERDLAAVVKQGEDRRGFKVKKTGPYFYIPLKNYLEEEGIDYRGNTRIVFDITKINEDYDGLPIFKMVRRDIVHEAKVMEAPEGVKKALSGAADEEDEPQEGEDA